MAVSWPAWKWMAISKSISPKLANRGLLTQNTSAGDFFLTITKEKM
jgi:hypothetical protein